MQEDPNQREDEEREASDEPVVEGNREDSVEAHLKFGQVDRVGEAGLASEPGHFVAEPEK